MKINTHGGNVHKFARQKGIAIQDILDFSANINPLGMHPKGVEAVKDRLSTAIHYPDPGNHILLQRLSTYLGVEKEMLTVGNGAAELLFALCRLPGYDRVYVPAPGFSEYALAADSVHLSVHAYEMVQQDKGDHWEFTYPWESLLTEDAIADHSILFLGNPNNPCGTLCDVEAVIRLLRDYEGRNILVVVDESFIDFTDGSHSLRSYVKDYSHLVVIHSLTKFFAIPGLRLGAMMSSVYIAEAMKRYIPAWSVNSLAQAYGETVLEDGKAYGKATRDLVNSEKERVFSAWCGWDGCKPVRPSVNYMLVQWLGDDEHSLDHLMASLEEENILIRDCRAYEGLRGAWFRIAIKDKTANQRLLDYMETYR